VRTHRSQYHILILVLAIVENAKSKGVPITYWENLDDLIKLSDCDVIIDEVGNYFDARLWSDLSLDARRWLTQGSKCGIEIYGSAQDFAQVDKSFRRLVNELHDIRKLCGSGRPSPTKPPIKRIWGLCAVNTMDPREYDEENKSLQRNLIPSGFFAIRRRDCEVFDTRQKILRSKPLPFRHEARTCKHHPSQGGAGECHFCKVIHV